jgi:hypothetical protein
MAREATKLILLAAAGLALAGVHAATAALPTATNGTMTEAVAGIDSDENGTVNATEWFIGGQRTFAALDQNKDGQISAEEFALIHHATFAVMDADHDGEVTVAEAAAYQRLPWTLGMFR